jgi:hypothetical protein
MHQELFALERIDVFKPSNKRLEPIPAQSCVRRQYRKLK